MKNRSLDEKLLFTSKGFAESKKYWVQYLKRSSMYGRYWLPCPGKEDDPGKAFRYRMDTRLAEKIRSLCKHNDLSIYIYILTAYCLLIRKYTHSRDLEIACPPFDGRFDEFLVQYNSIIPVIYSVDDTHSFKEQLLETKKTVLDNIKNQYYPLDEVYSELKTDNADKGYDFAFICEAVHKKEGIENIKASMTIKLDIGDELYFDLVCFAALPFTADRFFQHLCGIITVSLEDRSIVAGNIDLINDDREREEIMHWSNHKNGQVGSGFSLVDKLWSTMTGSPPGVSAIICKDTVISYGELLTLSNRMAAFLQNEWDLVPGDRVVVLVERSEWTLISLLSLLKSGLVYVPIDTGYPPNRIRRVLEEIHPALMITTFPLSYLTTIYSGKVMEIAALPVLLASDIPSHVSRKVNAGDEAYILYTSGSTGAPKGVIVTRGNLDQFFEGIHDQYIKNRPLSFPSIASCAFDISIFQLLTPILSGGTCVVVDKEQVQDMDRLVPLLKRVTAIDTVPALYQPLAEYIISNGISKSFRHIERIFVGGDAIPDALLPALSSAFEKAVITVIYGPTEGTIFCTSLEYYPGTVNIDSKGALLGSPLNRSEIYILGEKMNLLPAGVDGEICIGGPGVSKGYFGQSAPDKFLENPYRPGSMFYRTGDLARWTVEGKIMFRGRNDNQVKIRGHRIELGEVEAILQQYPGLALAVTTVIQDEHNHKRLVGYITPDRGIICDKKSILAYLKERLPEHMVPSQLIKLEKFPLTPNGKIDRKALPESDPEGYAEDHYASPRSALQQHLAGIWQDLLKVERIGINDNFFELGGDSIITIQVVSRARRYGYEIQPRDIFRHQDIETLSYFISERSSAGAAKAEQGDLEGPAGLLPVQQQFLEKDQPAVSHFNQSLILEINKSADEAGLKNVIRQLTAHHDSLRFTYDNSSGTWQQRYGTGSIALITEDLRQVQPNALSSTIEDKANGYQQSLSVDRGELVRFVWLLTPPTERNHRLLIIIHHLAVDGVSWRILLEDIEHCLSAFKKGQTPLLGQKGSSYREWYETLVTYGKSKRLLDQREYWRHTVQSYSPLPRDRESLESLRIKDMDNLTVRLDKERTKTMLHEISATYHTGASDILLCALGMTLGQWTGMDKLVIAMEGHGREDLGLAADASRTVGWFTSVYPVLLHVAKNKSPGEWLKSVKEELRRIPDKGIGYGVLKYINRERMTGEDQPWDIIFNYLGRTDNVVNKSEWFNAARERTGENVNTENKADTKFEINALIRDGELILNWRFSSRHYDRDTIAGLSEDYLSNLGLLIDDCRERGKSGPVYTPSDFGLEKEIGYEELDLFLSGSSPGGSKINLMETMYRLSGLQEGMLFHALYDESGVAYIVQLAGNLHGVDPGLFRDCWKYILRKHSILRSCFYPHVFRIPVQCVYRDVQIPLELLDLREMTPQDQEQAVFKYQESVRSKGFDLNEAPLMRLGLIRLSEDVYHMVWTTHHLILDGWSLPVLLQEFLSAYDHLLNGNELAESQEDKFEDYIRYIEGRDKYREELFWRRYLTGVESGTHLPLIAVARERNKGIGVYRKQKLHLDQAMSAKAASYAQRHRITMNTLMQGVWALLLHHYTGHDHILFGVTVSGRPEDLKGVESRVGMYINTLPLHACIRQDEKIAVWLQSLQQDQSDSREYQYSPLIDIQQWSEIQGDMFDSLLVFENYPVSKVANEKTRKLQVRDIQTKEKINYPLCIVVTTGEETDIQFDYNTRLLQDRQMEQIAAHFMQVLLWIAESTESASLKDVDLVTTVERERLLNRFNDTTAEYPLDRTILDMIAESASKTPDAVAVILEERSLSYANLDRRSNQLAHYLHKKGIRKEGLVGICMSRSPEYILCMLAILKAGGAYIPIDPAYPAGRIGYMLNDSGADIVLSRRADTVAIPEIAGVLVAELDLLWDEIDREPQTPLSAGITQDDLAYVIYTSGSTGRPKGVMIEHRGLINLVCWHIHAYGVNDRSKATSTAGVGFDAFGWEIWPYLAAGASIWLVDDDTRLSVAALCQQYLSHGITHSFLSTALVPDMIRETDGKILELTYLLTGGDKLPPVDPGGSGYRIVNNYGPTECTVVSSAYPLMGGEKYADPPIGRPIDNTRIYISGKNGDLAAIGVEGEICIGGAGLARGYINQPELTADKFVPNLFVPVRGERLYRTGDIGRWLPDGNILFTGRNDEQVKIRGHRIEIGEIEAVLQRSPGVRQAIVSVVTDSKSDKRLVGYIVPEGLFSKETIFAYGKKYLAEYMLPSLLMEIDRLPLTTNGKIDRKALPDPQDRLLAEYMAPVTKTEQKLTVIWQDLLGINRIGIRDNFFELGGHSLHATRLASAIKKDLLLLIPIRVLFELSTIEGLAAYIDLQFSLDQKPENSPSTFELIDL